MMAGRDPLKYEMSPAEYARLTGQTSRLPEVDFSTQHHTPAWSQIQEAMDAVKQHQQPPGHARTAPLPRPPSLYKLRDRKPKRKVGSDNELTTRFEQL